MTANLQLVVFDMAGTTVEDAGQVPAAFSAALRECGIALADEALANVRGASKREAIAELVARHAGPAWQGRADEVYASFVRHLEREFGAGVKPIEGAEACFDFLRSRGIKVALTTGFDRDVAGLLLDALRWRSRADAFVCGDDVVRGRPAPYLVFHAMAATGVDCVHRVGTVGDTTLDLQAGYNAGVKLNIGVLSGAHDRARLSKQPHTHIVASVAELPALLGSEGFDRISG
jgi:phosphonatase-like hydrolase